jgi:hypothetical protein
MISKLISPLEYPLFILAFGWLAERFGWFAEANANPDRKVVHKMDSRFNWALFMACFEYARAWHSEIGVAWQDHPNSALLLTLAVFAILLFAYRIEERRRQSPLTYAASPPAL